MHEQLDQPEILVVALSMDALFACKRLWQFDVSMEFGDAFGTQGQ